MSNDKVALKILGFMLTIIAVAWTIISVLSAQAQAGFYAGFFLGVLTLTHWSLAIYLWVKS